VETLAALELKGDALGATSLCVENLGRYCCTGNRGGAYFRCVAILYQENLVEGGLAVVHQPGDTVYGEHVTYRYSVLLAAGCENCVCHNFLNFRIAPAHAGWHIIYMPSLLASLKLKIFQKIAK